MISKTSWLVWLKNACATSLLSKVAFYLLCVLFAFGCLTPLLVNDKPWVMSLDQTVSYPIVTKIYPALQFGGVEGESADFYDPAVRQYIQDHGWAIWPPISVRFDNIDYWSQEGGFPAAPSKAHWLGTDAEGHDLLAALAYGLCVLLLTGVGSAMLALLVSVIIGGVQGYFGRNVDFVGHRLMEIWGSIPLLYLMMCASHFHHFMIPTMILMIGLTQWIWPARMVRNVFLHEKNKAYVLQAKMMGMHPIRVVFQEILPNLYPFIIAQAPLIIMRAMATLLTLDFLGFGLPQHYPSLGRLLQQGRDHLHAPWVLGSVSCLLVVLLVSLLLVAQAAEKGATRKKALVFLRDLEDVTPS